jgi:hypothetical protein
VARIGFRDAPKQRSERPQFFKRRLLTPVPNHQLRPGAGGPLISPEASLLLDFGQLFNAGMVNGNLQAPLASERTPLASDPQTRGIISDLLKAYPAALPNLPAVSLRQLNTNAPRRIMTADGLARLVLLGHKKNKMM